MKQSPLRDKLWMIEDQGGVGGALVCVMQPCAAARCTPACQCFASELQTAREHLQGWVSTSCSP